MRYLCVSKFVLCVVDVNGSQELLASFLTVNELALWDSTGIQYSISAIVDTEMITGCWQRLVIAGLSSYRPESLVPGK